MTATPVVAEDIRELLSGGPGETPGIAPSGGKTRALEGGAPDRTGELRLAWQLLFKQ
jgi:hypothetical protein